MSGAAIGSRIAGLLSFNERQRITLVGCGAAGAISSIFNAPITGMVFTVEVVLGDGPARNIIPIAIASVAGAEISRVLQGNRIAFAHRQFPVDLLDSLATVGLAVSPPRLRFCSPGRCDAPTASPPGCRFRCGCGRPAAGRWWA